jgi:D-alanyl-D-alanine carboxypeptidase
MPMGYRLPAPYVHGYENNTKGRRADVSEVLNATLAWASGGLVSSPLDLTRFVRAYAGGRLFGGATRAAQRSFRPGESDPKGPGVNSAGLALFRYRTPCGTVYGHTGNFLGYTAFIASSPDGFRSVTVQASTQLSGGTGDPRVYQALRRAFGLGVCAALS